MIQVRSDDEDVANLHLWVDGNEVPLSSTGTAYVTLDDPGSVSLVGTAVDHAGNIGTANGSVVVRDPNNAAPTVTITSPTANGTISEPTALQGSIVDPEDDLVSYVVSLARVDGGEFRTIEEVSAEPGQALDDIQQQALAVIDPTMLANGTYIVKVEATDASFNTSTVQRTIVVDGALKLGNFNMSFVDLEVPVAGIPITITRSYDTLDADTPGDFGYGWNLDIATTKVDLTLQNDGLTGYGNYPAFRDGDRVVITLPDGTEEGFIFQAQPNQTVWSKVIDYIPSFLPEHGVTSELIVDNSAWLKKRGDLYVYDGTGEAYNPANPTFGGTYELKLRNGNSLVIDARTGDLSTIYDPSNNALWFDDYGIHSSSGRGVQFERDFANRISAIVDPAGNRIEYDYDADGNLIKVTDRVDAETSFTYLDGPSDPPHYLDEVIDPYGRAAAKNEYDESGRLKSTTDADGKTIEYTWDGNTKIQHITNQLGHTTVVEVDGRGNVIREEGPEGSITIRTYDDDDNMESETIVIGQLDSPTNGETNDLTTTYDYNDQGDLLWTADARGNKTTTEPNQYGQPVTTTDIFGNVTKTGYDSRGLPKTITDANDQVTTFAFDDRGNLKSARNHENELLFTTTYNQFGDVTSTKSSGGHTVYFDYDINGDQIATWYFEEAGSDQVQILDVTYYDDARQATGSLRAVLPEGEFLTDNFESITIDPAYVDYTTSTTYDLNGQVLSSTDQFGFTTENTYDLRGQLIETRSESLDEAGNPVWLVSRSVYDAAGQQIASTSQYVEGTTDPISGSLTTYDAAGQVIASTQVEDIVIDVIGNGALQTTVLVDEGTTIYESSTEYDNAGRVVKTIDNYGLESRTYYNQFGDVVESRRQTFDENDQKVWLVNRTFYNDKGQVEFQTDTFLEGSGQTVYGTRTIYDAQGRATQSIRLSDLQIDMIDPATSQTVDPLTAGLAILDVQLTSEGTEISASSTDYNDKGQVEKSTSADGQVTEYEYDSLGRQVATLGHPVTAESVGLGADYAGAMVRYRSETIYDSQGRVESELANVIQVEYPGGETLIDRSQVQTTSYQYDEHGQRIRTTLTDGSYMLVRYDQFGRVIAESTQIADSVTAVWSEVENSFIDDASSAHVETKLYEYDAQGRLAAVQLPEVADPQDGDNMKRPRYEYEYDARGNQTVIRDPLGRETRFTYDEDGRMLSRTLPLGHGPDGEEGTADDTDLPEGDFTEQFEYDEMGRQVLHISFEGVHTRTVYDQATGRMLRQEFFADDTAYNGNTPGEVWTYLYDAFGREVEVIQDGDGSLATTGDQRAHRHTYDDRGRLTVVENAEGTIQYAYDDLGRKTAMKVFQAGADVLVDQPQRVTSYTYDALGRLASVTEDHDPSSSSDTPLETGYKYDLRGNLDETHLPGGVIEDYVYDELNRLDTLTHYLADETPETLADNEKLAEFDYTVRADGKRTAVTETYWLDENEDGTPEPQITEIDWTYDELGRLTSESIDHFDNQFDQTEWFEYDLVGNRLAKELDSDFDGTIDEAIAYLYDANDRLTTEEQDADNNGTVDQTMTYGYEHTQQTSKTVFDNSAQQTTSEQTFSYDLQGRLLAVVTKNYSGGTLAQHERVTYDYDASGIRVSALHEVDTNLDLTFDTSTRTEYLVDHHNFTGYQQVIKETVYDDQGQIVKTIEYNFGHDEISQTVTEYAGGVAGTPETHIFGHDGHGSVKVLYDAAAAILQVFTYEAYGQMLAIHNAIAAVVTTGALTSLQYSGEQFDSRIDQQYLRARYYDPNSGRFNRLDPFAGNSQDPQSFHKYLYTHGNPVMGVDPTGEMTIQGLMAGARSYMSLQSTRAQAAFATGGAALSRYWQAAGRHTERFAQNVISMFRFDTVLRNQRVGRNVIDFILRRGDRIMQLEVKYSIPQRFESSFTRLVNQITSMSNANGGNITVWSMRAPTVGTLNRLQRALGDDLYNRVQFADGIWGLHQVLRMYFGM